MQHYQNLANEIRENNSRNKTNKYFFVQVSFNNGNTWNGVICNCDDIFRIFTNDQDTGNFTESFFPSKAMAKKAIQVAKQNEKTKYKNISHYRYAIIEVGS